MLLVLCVIYFFSKLKSQFTNNKSMILNEIPTKELHFDVKTKFSALSTSINETEIVNLKNNHTNITVIRNMFPIKVFECEDADNSLCDKITEAYKSAGRRLSSIFKLKVPINIKVTWKNLCSESSDPVTCTTEILGQGSPSSYWSIDGIQNKLDSNYLYPQAVVKQYINSSDYGDHDILIAHDNRQKSKLWFPGEEQISNDKFEFEYIVLHEMMHGLGILSSLDTVFSIDKKALAPPLYQNDDKNWRIKKGYIFDKFLQFKTSVNHNLNKLDNIIINMIKNSQNFDYYKSSDMFEANFLASRSGESSRNLFLASTNPGSLFFVFDPAVDSKSDFGFYFDENDPTKIIYKHRNNSSNMDTYKNKVTKSMNNEIDMASIDNNIGSCISSPRKTSISSDESCETLALKRNKKGSIDNANQYKYTQKNILLHTPSTFVSGSSVCHFDPSIYDNTADFLMRPTAKLGRFLDEPQNLKYPGLVAGAFGPSLLHILMHIGYELDYDFINSNVSLDFKRSIDAPENSSCHRSFRKNLILFVFSCTTLSIL